MRVYQNNERIGMDDAGTDSGPAAMVDRLRLASNDHDIQAVAGCFAPNYRNETPVHPQRGFTGRDQVRRNWEQILASIPDLPGKGLPCAVDGDTAATQSAHLANLPDGSRHLNTGS